MIIIFLGDWSALSNGPACRRKISEQRSAHHREMKLTQSQACRPKKQTFHGSWSRPFCLCILSTHYQLLQLLLPSALACESQPYESYLEIMCTCKIHICVHLICLCILHEYVQQIYYIYILYVYFRMYIHFICISWKLYVYI